MYIKYFFLIFFYLIITHICLGQSGAQKPTGARAAGMGNTSVTLEDISAVVNNIAGVAKFDKLEASMSFQHRFAINSFNTTGLALALPTKRGTPAFHAHRFGDSFFNIQSLGAGYAHTINHTSLGVKLNYLQYNIDEHGTGRFLVMELGGIMELIPEIRIGAHIYNINQAKISSFQDERIPTVMKVGIAWQPDSKVLLSVETAKELEYKAAFRAGLEYRFIENFSARTGFSTNPFINTFGVGFNRSNLMIDYAAGINYQLGLLHQLTLSWKFSKNET